MFTLVFGPSGAGKSTILRSLTRRATKTKVLRFDDYLEHQSDDDDIPEAIREAAVQLHLAAMDALCSYDNVYVEEVCFNVSRRLFWYNAIRKLSDETGRIFNMNQILITAPMKVLLERVLKRNSKTGVSPAVTEETLRYQMKAFETYDEGIRKFDPDYTPTLKGNQNLNVKILKRGIEKLLRIDTHWLYIDDLLKYRITEWTQVNYVTIAPAAVYKRTSVEIEKDNKDKWRRRTIHMLLKGITSISLSTDIYQFLREVKSEVNEILEAATSQEQVYKDIRRLIEDNYDVALGSMEELL